MLINGFVNLGFTEKEKPLSKKNIIETNKIISKIKKEVIKSSKDEECLICKGKFNSFCNSHSIPQFVLRNITESGELYNPNIILGLPFVKDTEGLKQAGVFNLICKGCDSKVFQEYENPMNYKERPTQKMLAQIAMKNYLNEIGKKKRAIEIYKKINYNPMVEINSMDQAENFKNYNYARRNCDNISNGFYMFYYEKLDYVVPIAFQGPICLFFDIKGNLVNDPYNYSLKYELKDLHLCIFPLKESSVIIMFIKNGETRYRNFYKQFRKLEHNDKLLLIVYMIFAYSEDIYINKNLNDILKSNEKLKKITGQTSIGLFENDNQEKINEKLKVEYSFNNRFELPNLLSKKYSI